MVKTEGERKEKKKLKSAAMLSPKMPASIVTASFSPTPRSILSPCFDCFSLSLGFHFAM